jgi:hypothetical protein
MKDILLKYCSASEQRINNDKSSVILGKKCSNSVKAGIKVILEVPNESLNDKYLGLPSHVGRSK